MLDFQVLTLLRSVRQKYPFDKNIFYRVALLKMRSTFLKNKFEGVYFCLNSGCRPQMFSIALPKFISQSTFLQLVLLLFFFLVRDRSSHRRCSVKKGILRNFVILTGKHLCRSPWPEALLKKKLLHRCFPVNFVKFLRTSILQNTSRRLLLKRPSS